MPLKSIKYKKKALTFIELLVAISVLSISLVFILRAFSASIKAQAFSRDIIKSCDLVKYEVDSLKNKLRTNKEFSYSQQKRLDGFILSYEITPVDNSSLLLLKVKVFQDRPGGMTILEIITYLSKITVKTMGG